MRKMLLCCLTAATLAHAQIDHAVAPAFTGESARQFDFWLGAWDVNLRVQQPDASWQDKIKAKAHIFRILDGKAILELWDSEPIKGFSLRYFDPGQAKWVLWLKWPGPNRSSNSALTGAFRHGRGEFFSAFKNSDGEDVLSRYTFCDIAPNRLRWDDAYSKDGGKTWSNSWIMEFSRVADRAPWPKAFNAHTQTAENPCDRPEFQPLMRMAGRWQGSWNVLIDGAWQQGEAEMACYRAVRGCGLLQFLEYRLAGMSVKAFGFFTYDTAAERYELLALDSREGTSAHRYQGPREDGAWLLVQEGADGASRFEQRQDGDKLNLVISMKNQAGEWMAAARGALTRTDGP